MMGKNEVANLAEEIHSLVKYHELIGISHYPYTDDLAAFFKLQPSQGIIKTPVKPQSPAISRSGGRRTDTPVVRSPVKLSEIGAEVEVCRACDLHKKRVYPVAGSGTGKVRLMVVGDWLCSDEDDLLPEGQVFGVEQDRMLERMLGAISLDPADIFITNVIKCGLPAGTQPLAEQVNGCMSYLRRQIVALLPELICTMGMVAARAVLEKSQPLSRMRGQFHQYRVDKEVQIPVLATYHPTYLLQNPEMKQATWTDLQFLAKTMGLQIKN